MVEGGLALAPDPSTIHSAVNGSPPHELRSQGGTFVSEPWAHRMGAAGGAGDRGGGGAPGRGIRQGRRNRGRRGRPAIAAGELRLVGDSAMVDAIGEAGVGRVAAKVEVRLAWVADRPFANA